MITPLDTHKLIVGTSGAGKTTTARGEIEQLLDQRRHLVVIDPMDVYWGERSDIAGTGPGFDLPIFGGRHGDVELTAADGDAIARIIVEQRISAIVSIKHLHDEAAQRAFLLAFLRRLRTKPPGNFHLIVDEAEEFCPQVPPDDVAFDLTRLLNWFTKRGRSEGFVVTLITQRPADISKSVISMCETLIAHRLVAPLDQDAIDRYIKRFADRAVRQDIMTSLAGLATGERWLYSPALQILERGFSPPIRTFDSSKTPAPGETPVEPRMLSQVDMSAIAALLARPAPAPEAVDASAAGKVAAEAFADRDRKIADLEARIVELEAENRMFADEAVALIDAGFRAREILNDAMLGRSPRPLVVAAPIDPTQIHEAMLGHRPEISLSFSETAPRAAIAQRGETAGVAPSAVSDQGTIRGRKALLVLASASPAGLTEAQWAQLAGYARKGGTWGTYKGTLRASGLVEQRGDLWFATGAGIDAVGAESSSMPPPGADLARFWAQRISGVRRMVDVLIKRFPHFTTREALAADLGMSEKGGTFGTYLGRLRSNGLLDEQGKRVRLSPTLMVAP